MDKRNIGKFEIPVKLIDSDPGLIAKIFAALKLVPVKVETMYYKDAIEYVALSELFTAISSGETIPEYGIEISRHEGGSVSITLHCPAECTVQFKGFL